jgi:hypothetical protein
MNALLDEALAALKIFHEKAAALLADPADVLPAGVRQYVNSVHDPASVFLARIEELLGQPPAPQPPVQEPPSPPAPEPPVQEPPAPEPPEQEPAS